MPCRTPSLVHAAVLFYFKVTDVCLCSFSNGEFEALLVFALLFFIVFHPHLFILVKSSDSSLWWDELPQPDL